MRSGLRYYPTGDLGAADGDGFLFFHGRCADMFTVGGGTGKLDPTCLRVLLAGS